MRQLDGLRAIAAFAVLVQHSIPIPGINIGVAGVRLFFVLSGFLITGILLRERQGCRTTAGMFRAFYARRFLRIIPLYYFAVVLTTLLHFDGSRRSLPWHLTYMTNWLIAGTPGFVGANIHVSLSHFWSLAVEEQFYIFWPAIVLLMPRRWLPAIFGILAVSGPLSRLIFAYCAPHKAGWLVATPCCLDSLCVGGLLALALQARGLSSRMDRLLGAGFCLGVLIFCAVIGFHVVGRGWLAGIMLEGSAVTLISVWAVGKAAKGFRGFGRHLLEFKPLVYLGAISYGIYVYQGVVPEILQKLGCPWPAYHTFAALVAITCATIPVAALSWHLFEKPLNELKRYFPYEKPSATGSLEPRIASTLGIERPQAATTAI